MSKKEISLTDLRSIQLNIMDQFVNICEKYQLRYYLCGGTQLGAIRHRGYIPWDDDIDVMMPRPDYDNLLNLVKEINTSKYHIKSPYDYDERPYPYVYAKMFNMETTLIEQPNTKAIKSHVYIDIFPIDGLPSDESECQAYFKKMKVWKNIHRILSVSKCNTRYGSLWKKIFWSIIYLFSKIIKENVVLSILEKKLRKYSFDSSDYVGIIAAGYGDRERTSRKAYEELPMQFEDRVFNGIKGYDEYLTNVYGDYMKLPPEEKRILAHDNIAFYS